MKRLPTAFLLFLLTGLTPVAMAQTAVPAGGTTITAAGGTAYTSSEGGVLTMNVGGGNQTGALTGNLGVLINMSGNTNGNRLTLSGANNFSGGFTISTGTVVANKANWGTGIITLTNGGTFMINSTDPTQREIPQTQSIIIDGSGALRPSNNIVVRGPITSKTGTSGDLLIHCESGKIVTLYNTGNSYSGVTNIGGYNVSGSSNSNVSLQLGANNVLPDTTVVQVGKTWGTANAKTVLADSQLMLNGFSDTVAGLEGEGKVTNTGATSSLTLNLASGANYTLSGAVTGSAADKGIGIIVTGAGIETLSGTLTYAALQVKDTATMVINNTQSSLQNLSVASGATLNAANTGDALQLTINGTGRSTLAGTIGASSVTINHTGLGSLALEKDYSNMTINMSNGGLILDPGATWDSSPTFTYHGATVNMSGNAGLDVNGQTISYDVLPDYSLYNSGANATINLGNNTTDGTFTGQFTGGSNGLTINKTGTNSQTIAGGFNTSKTSININGGKIVLGKTEAVTAASNITVNSGGTLEIAANGVQQRISGTLTINTGCTVNMGVGSHLFAGVLSGAYALDLKGGSLSISQVSSTNITNSNAATTSQLAITPTANFTGAQTLSSLVSGNIRVVVDLFANANNANRLILSNTANSFTGGVEIKQGTLRVDNFATLGSLPNDTIDFNGGSLMTSARTVSKNINLLSGGGALRATGGDTNFSGKITGVGSLEILNDAAIILSNTGNNYQGNTLIGVTGFRSDNLVAGATLKLGASGVLPDSTVVQLGGGVITGASVLNMNNVSETVAGIKGSNLGQITGGGTLTLNTKGSTNNDYKGNILGGTNLVVAGSGVQTLSGNNSAAGTMTVSGGTLHAASDNARKFQAINLSGGTLTADSAARFTNAGAIHALSGTSKIVVPMTRNSTEWGYTRELFTSPDLVKIDSYYQYAGGFTSAATTVANIDSITNIAFASGGFDANAWGSKASDQSNTNLLQTTIVNVTQDPISLDFARCFHNDAMLVVTDSEGNEVGRMDWATVGNSSNNSISAKDFSATGYDPVRGSTLTVVLDPGEEYTLEMRLSRFNKTIGAKAGGVNNDTSKPIGMGVKVTGSSDNYLALNIDPATGQWAFDNDSFYVGNYTGEGTFANDLTVDAGATITFENSVPGTVNYTGTYSGSGTVRFESPYNASQAVFSGTSEGSLDIADGLTFTTSGDSVSVAGELNLSDNSTEWISVDNGQISVGSLAGSGQIVVDMDSLTWDADNVSGTWITLTGDAGDTDLSNISLNLLTDNPGDYSGKTLNLFGGIIIPDTVMSSLLSEDSPWIASALAGGTGLALSYDNAKVPEPASCLLLLVGLGGLVWFRRLGKPNRA